MLFIQEYQQAVKEAVDILETHFQTKNLMDWRAKKLAQSGVIDSKYHYSFHGIGCHFDFGFKEIDFDFGFDGNVNGFDEWRLLNFAEDSDTKYTQYRDENTLKSDFSTLIELGKIKRINVDFNDDNYYFVGL